MVNKAAVITGAGSGIGQATALLFAREGAKVAVADLDKEAGARTVDMIKENGGDAVGVVVDVSKASEALRMVEGVMDAFGRIDVLVNNAGVFTEGDVVATSVEDWNRILEINLSGVFFCMKYCIPEMIKVGGGVVVNISSEAGLVSIGNQVAYNVSKAAVIALSKSAALDFAGDNIRVNCLCPGRTLTPLVNEIITSSQDPEGTRRLLSEDRPMKRMGKPEEIAAGILFLASDEVAYATGSVLSIDGGYTLP